MVTCRRSPGGVADAAGAVAGGAARRAAMAASSCLRWPSDATPRSLQVCVGELGQNGLVYIVLGERACVPSEAQCLQERVDVHSASVTQITAAGTLRALAVSGSSGA